MDRLARIWFVLLAFGAVFLIGGVVGTKDALVEKPVELTWAQFVEREPDRKWFRIADAPFVDARTVRMVRQKKIGHAEDAYVPVVLDPADPTGPVRVFFHVTEENLGLAPPVEAGAAPVVQRRPLEGWKIRISDGTTRSLLNRQGAPVAANMTVLRAGGAKPLWLGALCIVGGAAALFGGWKGWLHRVRTRKAAKAPAPAPPRDELYEEVARRKAEERRRQDLATLEALQKAGSDLSKPHMIEHHFVCGDELEAAGAVGWGRANGYEPSEVRRGRFRGEEYVHFDLVVSAVPSIERIEAESTAMADLADRMGIDYDGWGCKVVT